MFKTITLDIDQCGVCSLKLNRPSKLNSFSLELIEDLYNAIHIIQETPHILCVIVSGEGSHFSSGLDILNISKDPTNFGKLLHPYDASKRRWSDYSFSSPPNTYNYPSTSTSTHNLIQHLTIGLKLIQVPVIAAITGVCIGIAFQFVMGADIRIASHDTKMSILEAKWGLIPDVGITEVALNVIPEDVLRLMTFTGDFIQGHEKLVQFRLVTEIHQQPYTRAMEIAQVIASRSPDSTRNAKILFNSSYHPIICPNPLLSQSNDHTQGLQSPLQPQSQSQSQSSIHQPHTTTPPTTTSPSYDHPPLNSLHIEESLQRQLLGSPNQLEAVKANIEKRKPKFVLSKL